MSDDEAARREAHETLRRRLGIPASEPATDEEMRAAVAWWRQNQPSEAERRAQREMERLTELYPEQMTRDPSGELARLTDEAAAASSGHPERVRYLHDRCGGPLALAGTTPDGQGLFVAHIAAFEKVPQGHVAVEPPNGGDRSIAWARMGAKALSIKTAPGAGVTNKKRSGWDRPDGHTALVDEPLGFAPGPAVFAVRCGNPKCARWGELSRAKVADDLRRYEGPAHPIHHRLRS